MRIVWIRNSSRPDQGVTPNKKRIAIVVTFFFIIVTALIGDLVLSQTEYVPRAPETEEMYLDQLTRELFHLKEILLDVGGD